jgi:hypothetical protein
VREFQIVLLGAVFWTVLGVGMIGAGISAGLKFNGWKRVVASGVGLIGVLLLLVALKKSAAFFDGFTVLE